MNRGYVLSIFAISASIVMTSVFTPSALAAAAEPPAIESETEESAAETELNETESDSREDMSETIAEESATETEEKSAAKTAEEPAIETAEESAAETAEESTAETVESDIETESETEEENPVVEVTEHGIVITRSCAEAIDRKLDNLNNGKFDYSRFWEFDIYTNEHIDPVEFEDISHVTRGYEEAHQFMGECVYHITFSEYLTMREMAALFAEDERVTKIEFVYDPMPSPWPHIVSDRQVFRDDDQKAYFHKPLCWTAANLITRIPCDAAFGVGKKCSRKDFVIFLWRTSDRMVSAKYHSIHNTFTDISSYSFDSDTYRALTWAVNEGIVKGFKDGGFHPDEAISRKDALIMIYRAFGEAVSGEVPFKDIQKRGYAKQSDTYQAIAWAVEKGITKGYSDGTFRPMDPCLREQAVTFLCRFMKPVFY